ncbi:sigma-54-dependent Fis family transcriptional regulator [Stagnimonas aquatica]|uniref:Sigma-54-dependent Fis family transcriptional regulator n=1 Tax=Stagnimonas aquatica TaxID=2689987 RepID=A0A3N0VH47_9GAMM|nr:sigma-54 dependent transcriptional regulator [Stagnimonas aquatica]ROH92087.1 sigma-54-dependent Fis family transcriptional regulator [Stagnimonas aquatica]
MSTAANPPALALIVDDEADIRELVELTLMRMGLRTQAAGDLAQARELLATQSIDFCITDMRLPDGLGLELVREYSGKLPIAVITAYGNAEMAVESLKAGAFDFVSKPVDLGMLRKLVDSALKLRAPPAPAPIAAPASAAATPARAETAADGDSGGLLGEATAIQQLRALVERLARSQAPVHIAGESGTGKELTARLIHAKSPRGSGPFVAVNCGAIPSELMESEFFGHRKGSFTGASKDKTGLFQAAEGGTLFLDEVADLPLHMQVKLLRAVQERAVRPVGADSELPVNVRIISATHKSLTELVARGAFRQDLYYRLNVIEVRTPALRERREDIPLLATAILKRLAAANGLGKPPGLDRSALELLSGYSFPGNVRELENTLERAITLSDGARITAEDLQLRPCLPTEGSAEPTTAPPGPATARPAGLPVVGGGALDAHVEELEKQAIREALEKTRWNKTKAAELLGMSFRSLRYRIKKLGIE